MDYVHRTKKIDDLSAVTHAASYIASKTTHCPRIGIVLGSGLGEVGNQLEQVVSLLYATIPHFPLSTVDGHDGQWLMGTWDGVPVILMKGRFHLYEGYDAQTVTFPMRVMRALGVETLIQTNAAGAIQTDFRVGDLMVITDHLNATGRNPLTGPNDASWGLRFPDLSRAYSPRLRQIAHAVAATVGISLREGVYAGVLGPSFETPAEIRMLRHWGADAVGMSTVMETIAARHAGMEVLGISCMSNMAAGILDQPLTHEEVMETGERIKPLLTALVAGIVKRL